MTSNDSKTVVEESKGQRLRVGVQRFGGHLAGMVMPNIGAFIAWGLITAMFIPTGWFPNEDIAELVGPMITFLLPVLIGYTGGRIVHGQRGAVVGAIATMYEMRRTRSALSRVEAPQTLQGSGDEAAAISELAMLVGAARAAEATTKQWLARPLPGDASLLATPLGTAALADSILPEVWDADSDLVVLVG